MLRLTTMLAWDGSHLGTFRKEEIEEVGEIKIGRRLSCYYFPKYDQLLLTKSIDSFIPAILDELKPFFGLPKIGTHTFRYGGRLMIGYKPFYLPQSRNNKIPYHEMTLDCFPSEFNSYTPFLHQVILTWTFRELFGITDSYEHSILMRYYHPDDSTQNEVPTIISFLEPSTLYQSNNPLASVLTNIIHQKWFSQMSVTETVHQLIGLNREYPQGTINQYRGLIIAVIKRIDKEEIGFLDYFLGRLFQYITT